MVESFAISRAAERRPPTAETRNPCADGKLFRGSLQPFPRLPMTAEPDPGPCRQIRLPAEALTPRVEQGENPSRRMAMLVILIEGIHRARLLHGLGSDRHGERGLRAASLQTARSRRVGEPRHKRPRQTAE